MPCGAEGGDGARTRRCRRWNTVVSFMILRTHATFAPSDKGFEEVSPVVFERCLCDCAIVDMRPEGHQEREPAVEDESLARPTGVVEPVFPSLPAGG